MLELIYTVMAVYYILLNKTVGEAQVFMNAQKITFPSTVKIAIRQKVKKPVLLEETLAGLKCIKTSRTRTRGKTKTYTETVYDELKPVESNRQLRAGENLECTVDISAPENIPPSTQADGSGYPRIDWFLCVKIRIASSPDYTNDFHILVENPSFSSNDEEMNA